ncbi:MAG: NTP transferase domain-containing protein [Microthrixaceae bacterium]|nr:NTP transferase domain-containing protein [Microthrixaceae bacterium]
MGAASEAAVSRLVGAVLVGGESSRMGTDKASLVVDGVELGRRAVDALRGAGLDDVMLVGATEAHASLPGRPVDDLWPGEGPVGAVLTALHEAFLAGGSGVVCLPCDLPGVAASDVTVLVDASAGAGSKQVTLAAVGGRRAFPVGVWPIALLPALEDRFGDGASSFRELLDGIDVAEVEVGDGFVDADTPNDLS